jgi:MFS family permease
MNRTLKLLIFSDIFLLTGFGLVSPIMAIFINGNIVGGTIAAVGIASMITIVVRCLLQLLFANIGKPGQRYGMALTGTLMIATVPFIYLFSNNIWQIFIGAFINGLGAGLANPAWFSLFSENLDEGQRGWEWSIYSSSVGFGTAAAALVGSWLATRFGFRPVFAVMGILAVLGALLLIGLFKKDYNRKRGLIKKNKKRSIPDKIGSTGAKMKLHAHR